MTTKSVGRSVVGGILFGAPGAIVGALTTPSRTETKTGTYRTEEDYKVYLYFKDDKRGLNGINKIMLYIGSSKSEANSIREKLESISENNFKSMLENIRKQS